MVGAKEDEVEYIQICRIKNTTDCAMPTELSPYLCHRFVLDASCDLKTSHIVIKINTANNICNHLLQQDYSIICLSNVYPSG